MKSFKLIPPRARQCLALAVLGLACAINLGAKEDRVVHISIPKRLQTLSAKPVQAAKTPFDAADQDRRRAAFLQLCANPTPSQRDTLDKWAKDEKSALNDYFCKSMGLRYFGTPKEPRGYDSFTLTASDITDLSPFQYFNSITHLQLSRNKISDLSPIANYKLIKKIHLSNNNIKDASVIANFKNIESLDLSYNPITNIDLLSELTELRELTLLIKKEETAFDSISSLKKLNKLHTLSLAPNITIRDELNNLKELKSLQIFGAIENVCVFKDFTKLTLISFARNNIKDISCLSNLKKIDYIDIDHNPIRDISTFAPMPDLIHLSIKNTLIEDLSAFTGKTPKIESVETDNAPLRWCSPSTSLDIKGGVSCFNPDGTEKSWWRRALRM